jgi:sulfatase maturation enzyme AslB (radical SAM superfamily)
MILRPTDCYACFSMLFIRPSREGFADLSTCCTHIDKKVNRLVTAGNLARSWNHSRFQHQRALVHNNNWSFCYGNRCMPFRMFPDFDRLQKSPVISDALKNHRTELSYLPKVLWIITSYDCNNNCSFCYQRRENNSRRMYTLRPNIVSEIKSDLIPQAKKVVFTGGEPLMNDVGLIQFITKQYPSVELGIGTNGVLLHEYGIERIIEEKIHLTISVYGFEKSLYNKITRSTNYDLFIKNINDLLDKDYGENITLDYMVCDKETLAKLPEFLRFLRFNPSLSAIIRDDHWGGPKFQRGLMSICNNGFADILDRINIYVRGQNIFERFLNKVYGKIYDFKTRTI